MASEACCSAAFPCAIAFLRATGTPTSLYLSPSRYRTFTCVFLVVILRSKGGAAAGWEVQLRISRANQLWHKESYRKSLKGREGEKMYSAVVCA